MTKKDYVAFAKLVREHQAWAATATNPDTASYVTGELVARMVALFRADNPRFDAARFVEAARGQ